MPVVAHYADLLSVLWLVVITLAVVLLGVLLAPAVRRRRTSGRESATDVRPL